MTSSEPATDVGQIYARYRGDIQAALRAALPTESVTPDLYDILRYHLGWLDANLAPASAHGGKSFRPTLCLLSCEAVSGDYRQAMETCLQLGEWDGFAGRRREAPLDSLVSRRLR